MLSRSIRNNDIANVKLAISRSEVLVADHLIDAALLKTAEIYLFLEPLVTEKFETIDIIEAICCGGNDELAAIIKPIDETFDVDAFEGTKGYNVIKNAIKYGYKLQHLVPLLWSIENDRYDLVEYFFPYGNYTEAEKIRITICAAYRGDAKTMKYIMENGGIKIPNLLDYTREYPMYDKIRYIRSIYDSN